MDQHLGGLTGVVSIADNIVVFDENEENHDWNLVNLMEWAERNGLVFNSKKCHIKQSCVSFFGNIYTPEGIKPDPDKVRDIRNMASPQSKEDVQRFLGMLMYLSQFIPQLADRTYSTVSSRRTSHGHGTHINRLVLMHWWERFPKMHASSNMTGEPQCSSKLTLPRKGWKLHWYKMANQWRLAQRH